MAQVCAVIPARGGSKGVPRKNVREIGGQPLIARAVRSLVATDGIDVVVVTTDDDEIAGVAAAAGAVVVRRPAELAGDEASSESALLHALDALEQTPDVLVFAQATSPFIDPSDVAHAVKLVGDGTCDVAFAATRTDVFLWKQGPDGVTGVNHDMTTRPRRQDREPEWAETGAFYVMRVDGFRQHRHRFFGRVEIVEVQAADAVDVDTPADLELARAIDSLRAPADEVIPARAVVTDFDGVHTADRVVVDQHGVESVEVNRTDGMGVSLLRRAGVPVLILSTEQNPVVGVRGRKLGVDVIAGCDDKLTALTTWARDHDVALADVAYLGNDVNDVACLRAVGWPVVVADAHRDARRASRIELRHSGGDGAVRELADRVLASRRQEGNDDD